jgi:polysaccharide export outer membrane protein
MVKMRYSIILSSLSIILILSSCVSRKKLTYLQYSDKSPISDISVSDTRTSVTPASYKIMPYDNLYIRVLTPDPQYSALFNMEVGTGTLTQESAGLAGYSVDTDGNIEIPYVGKVKIAGKTLSEVKVELDSIFKNYVSDGAITVKLVNNAVSIIGEVSVPGRYIIYKDRINVFEALSLASDLTAYGNRQKVQLIRPSPYGPLVKEFSLADRSILTSEFYYVMPNDIIYVMPMQGRSFVTNSSIYTLFLSTITTALVVISYFRIL